MDLESVAVSHIKCVWTVFWPNPLPVEQEAYSRKLFPLSVAEGIHQLFQLRRLLDLEEDFVIIIRDFDVQMFGWWGRRILATVGRVLVF